MSYKIKIASQQRYSCILCGNCCRRFKVLLRPGEIERLSALPWGAERPYTGKFYEYFNGFPYFKRKENGACVFQDDENSCIMHRRFGFDIKALTCRGYPFNFVSTFPGEISVMARMDCPAVLQNKGELLTKQKRDIEKLAAELNFAGGFTEKDLQGLNRKSLELICSKFQKMLQNESIPLWKTVGQMMTLSHKLEKLQVNFLNDSKTLEEIFPSLMEKSLAEFEKEAQKGLSSFSRSFFRLLLSAYCFRDEEMLDTGIAARTKKAWQLASNVFGRGNWRNYSQEHPDIDIKDVKMFRNNEKVTADDSAWINWQRFIDVRLECYQFFAHAYYQQNFFTGLRALLLTYPLALAKARVNATANKREKIEKEDVDYAVASIDHCHGRTARLKFLYHRQNEKYFSGERFPLLLFDLGLQ